MSVGCFVIGFDASAVVVVIPIMLTNFHISVAQAGWVSSGYLVSYVVLVLPGGRLGARFGERNIYLAGLLVFVLASLGCGLSGTFTALIVARVIQGVGAALMAPQPMAVVTHIFPAENRGPAIALWSMVGGVAGFCGPIVGGGIITNLGWQWIFLINLPIGIIAFALAAAYVPVLPNSSQNLDVLGTVFSGVAIALAVFGIQYGPQYHWARIAGSYITVSEVLALSLLFAAVFILHQWKYATEPLISSRIFRNRNFSAGLAANIIGTFGLASLALPLMLYAQNVRGMSPVGAALFFVPLGVASILMAPVAGWLTSKIQPRILALSGFIVMLTVLTLLVTEFEPTTPMWVIGLLTAVMGGGASLAGTAVGTVTLRNLSPDLAGTGSGLLTAAGLFSAVLASACMASILDVMLGSQSGFSSGDLMLAAARMRYAHGIAQSVMLPTVATFFGALVCLKMNDFPELPRSFRWTRRLGVTSPSERPVAVSDVYSPEVVAVSRKEEC